MKNILFIFLLSLISTVSWSQDSTTVDTARYKISLITCGPGQELYSLFGHSGIRVLDRETQQDIVYNYGTFDDSDPDFYKNFVKGKLDYWVSTSSFNSFINYYKRVNRTVKETPITIAAADAEKLVRKLETNLLPENKTYLYDFLYANCATKIRDMFENVDMEFPVEFGTILKGEKISYRQIINQYMINDHWSRVGINILLGSPVDSIMSDYHSMFLPDFLEVGTKYARFKNQDFAGDTLTLFESDKSNNTYKSFNGPFWVSIILLVVVILSYHVRVLGFLKPIVNFVILLFTGVLGLFLVFMWVGTDHQSTTNNWNILWALPTNIILAFIAHKKKVWFKIYALAGISCVIVALIIHVIGLQLLPLAEIFPLLGCLIYVYMYIYYQAIFKLAEEKRDELMKSSTSIQ